MPNVALLTDHGDPLILPAGDINAIITLEGTPAPPNHPEAKAVLYSRFRGFSINFLGQSAVDAWSEVKSRFKDGEAPEMLVLKGVEGDDCTIVREADIIGIEGIRPPDGDESKRSLRVSLSRGDDEQVFADVAYEQDLVERLTKMLLERKDGPDLPPLDDAEGKVRVVPIAKRRRK